MSMLPAYNNPQEMWSASIACLRSAREKVSGGWTQGQSSRFENGCKSYCLLGAIGRWVGPLRRALHAATGAKSLIDWNDDPSRTQDDVLAAIDRAIEIIEGWRDEEVKERTMITVENPFHGTKARFLLPSSGVITAATMNRVRRTLCPVEGCSHCSGPTVSAADMVWLGLATPLYYGRVLRAYQLTEEL